MDGFATKLESETKHHREQGLVWVGDADLSKYFRKSASAHRHTRTAGPLRMRCTAPEENAGRRRSCIAMQDGPPAGGAASCCRGDDADASRGSDVRDQELIVERPCAAGRPAPSPRDSLVACFPGVKNKAFTRGTSRTTSRVVPRGLRSPRDAETLRHFAWFGQAEDRMNRARRKAVRISTRRWDGGRSVVRIGSARRTKKRSKIGSLAQRWSDAAKQPRDEVASARRVEVRTSTGASRTLSDRRLDEAERRRSVAFVSPIRGRSSGAAWASR